jgi:hypothetical protein
MRKISSNQTFFYKRVFPLIWLGGVSIFLITILIALPNSIVKIPFTAIPTIMLILGALFFRSFIMNLIDEVYDEGDSLLLINRNIRVNVKLKDIKNINYQHNPPKMTLSIRHKTELGSEISFYPPKNKKILGFGKNELLDELIDRIDKSRQL